MKVDYTLSRLDWLAFFIFAKDHNWRTYRSWSANLQFTLLYLAVFAAVIIVGAAVFFAACILFHNIEVGMFDLGYALATLVTVLFGFVVLVGFKYYRHFYGQTVQESLQRRHLERVIDHEIDTGSILTKNRHVATLGPDGITLCSDYEGSRDRVETTIHMDQIVAWSAVHSIELTEGYIFILVSRWVSFILPRRAFSSDEAFFGFGDAAKRWKETGFSVVEGGLETAIKANR